MKDYSVAPWQIVECRRCGFVFLHNPPSYEKLEVDFAWEKTAQKVSTIRHAQAPVLAAVAKSTKRLRRTLIKRQKIRDLIIEFMPDDPKSVIDIGCMNGRTVIRLCNELIEAGHEPNPIGIEISAELAKVATRKLRNIKGTCIHADALRALRSLPDASSGIVIMSAYLEHEYQPRLVLEQIRRVLTPDGIAVLKVPNYASWNRRLSGPSWCGFRYPDHVNYFTPKTLRTLCKLAALAIIRCNWHDCFPTSDNMYAVLSPTANSPRNPDSPTQTAPSSEPLESTQPPDHQCSKSMIIPALPRFRRLPNLALPTPAPPNTPSRSSPLTYFSY